MSNLHKSEEGWRRFQERTGGGVRARRADMRTTASKPRSKQIDPPELPPSRQEKLRTRKRVVIER